MKKLMLIWFFVGFLMSGCIVYETSGRKGPPWWAPANGYRRHTHTTIIFTPAPNDYRYNNYHYNRGHGHWKH